jgi:hypothetical protein
MTSLKSSGSSRAPSAVDPTRSTNMTVSSRRSADSFADVSESDDVAFAFGSARRAAMALSSLRRCPTAALPTAYLLRSRRSLFFDGRFFVACDVDWPLAAERSKPSRCDRPCIAHGITRRVIRVAII